MNKNLEYRIVIGIVLIVLLVAGLGLVFHLFNRDKAATRETISSNTPTPQPSPTVVTEAAITVTAPTANSLVASPLEVTGKARGNWFFEAVFPVRLLDSNGVEIAHGNAAAQGEWMTDDYVPFKATLTFATPTTETGTLRLEKDNPSGLPENDDAVLVPVKFR